MVNIDEIDAEVKSKEDKSNYTTQQVNERINILINAINNEVIPILEDHEERPQRIEGHPLFKNY